MPLTRNFSEVLQAEHPVIYPTDYDAAWLGVPDAVFGSVLGLTPTAGKVYGSGPVLAREDIHISSLNMFLSSGGAGSEIRMGIYEVGDGLAPDALIVDGGTPQAATAASKITQSVDVTIAKGTLFQPVFVAKATSPGVRLFPNFRNFGIVKDATGGAVATPSYFLGTATGVLTTDAFPATAGAGAIQTSTLGYNYQFIFLEFERA